MAADEEEVAQGSPSPAPRSWRSRRDPAEKRSLKTLSTACSESQQSQELNKQSLESGRGAGSDDLPIPSHQSDTSDSTFDEKLRQHALKNTGTEASTHRGNGLLSRSRLGNKIVETGRELVRKTSRSSVDGGGSPRALKSTTNGTWLSRRLPGRKRGSSDASSTPEPAEWGQIGDDFHDEALQPGMTPNKSFAWQADADFTADDLQISNSPPVVIGRSNTKIEKIRALEAEVNDKLSESPRYPSRNPRIDEIRALEAADTGPNLDDEPTESGDAADGINNTNLGGDHQAPRRMSITQTSTKVDDSRSHEIERLTRRALATARLDELREKHTENLSHSSSPDVARRSSREPLRSFSPLRERLWRLDNEAHAAVAQTQPAPVPQTTLVPALRARDHSPADAAGKESGGASLATSQPNGDPRSGLQQPVVPASPSLSLERRTVTDNAGRGREIGEGACQKKPNGADKTGVRPTVGFAGLPRSASSESGLSKRASFVHSDSDPTDRIEGEMKLFAPMDNQSERGSLRAPSPEPEEDAADETPKPIKPDPLTMPTPRVTGAFVETPATVKVEKIDDSIAAASAESNGTEPERNGHRQASTDGGVDTKPSLPKGGGHGTAARPQKRTQSAKGDRFPNRSSSLSARRRARSFSRGRAPLINSAKPPTVKDDLLEIQQANQIDDSTLEDIADLMAQLDDNGSISDSPEAKAENGSSDKLDWEKELESFDRMARSLKTGLMGIRSAKQGIQDLEKKILQADIKESGHTHAPHGDGVEKTPASCTICQGAQPATHEAVTYVHLPVPRLWYRKPKFRFTLLGLLLFLFSFWYTAESTMCYFFCKPEFCYAGRPCNWSPDDPTWGYAIPVKLDQWVTGAQGRSLVRQYGPDVSDWLLDLWDTVTGTDITTVNTYGYSPDQMRQHRRRLAKWRQHQGLARRQEDKAAYDQWRAVRQAQEEEEEAREMGYEVEDEIIADDEPV